MPCRLEIGVQLNQFWGFPLSRGWRVAQGAGAVFVGVECRKRLAPGRVWVVDMPWAIVGTTA
jgi:hypothetical protein